MTRPAPRLTPTEPAGSFPDPLITGEAVTLSPRVRRVLAPNPGFMTGPGTNTYLVGTAEVTVIDPGPDDPSHLEAILAAGAGAITRILCTHTHIDHWPAAVGLAERTGAPILAYGSRDGLEVDATLAGDDVLVAADHRIRAIHTPGHASNHLCFLLEDEAVLFSGDHVMQGSTVVISPPDGDMRAYLDSLSRLAALDPPLAAIAPAHGHLLTDPAAVLAGYVAHRLDREAIVARVLAEHPEGATVDVLVPAVYPDIAEAVYPVARRSLWAHLRKLADDGRATVDDRDDVDGARWTPR